MSLPLRIYHSEIDEFRAFNFITSYADNGNPRYLWYVRKRKGKGEKERNVKPVSEDNAINKVGAPGSAKRIAEYARQAAQGLTLFHE